MAAPLAYFLTWTCYGQRLHGDERGSVDRSHNQPGTPYLSPDPHRERREQARMIGSPITLTTAMRQVVDAAIVELSADRRWMLMARNVRPTHVHVVVSCPSGLSPERALAQIKARATRNLRRANLLSDDARLWTDHGSTRWINHYEGLYGAIAYVNDWQSGPHREILEQHKRLIRQQLESLNAWLRSQGLPEDGRTVVWGEGTADRAARLRGNTRKPSENALDEPRTQ